MSLVKANGAGEVSTGFYNGVITSSCRFNGSTSKLVSPAFSSDLGNTWTWSAWVKFTNQTSDRRGTLFNVVGQNASLYFDNTSQDFLSINDDGAAVRSTSRVLRDPSSWYHIVLNGNGTLNKLWINGALATFNTDPNLDDFNTANAHQIGGSPFGTNYFFDGIMADINFVSETALDYTAFAETKNDILIPKEPNVTYGANGFRLQFEQTGSGADANGIGADTSGNNNHFTATGLDSYDVLPDSPENNFPTFNPLFKTNTGKIAWVNNSITLSEGNLRADLNTGNETQSGAFATFTVPTSGKWYWEMLCIAEASGSIAATGVIEALTGTYVRNQSNTTGRTFAAGDIINIAFDADNNRIFFGINGTFPANQTPTDSSDGTAATGSDYLPYVWGNHASSPNQFAANFGQDSSFAGQKTAQNNTDANGVGDFYYSVPSSDYLALCSANIPDTTLSPAEDEQATDYFNTVLYTGNGSSRSITGVGFQPDLSWFKARSVNSDHYWYDSTRGANKSLTSNKSVAEDTTGGQFTSFDSDGFTLPDDTAGYVNYSSRTYVAWNWRLNGGTTSSDTNGSRTTTIQTNANAGISIATYNNPSQGNHTFGHGLGSKPEAFIWRARNTVMNWIWWDSLNFTDADRDGLYLSASSGFTTNSNWVTDVTDTTINITDGQVSSGNNIDYWCISYKSVPGFSKIGNYTGNGLSNGTFVHTGFRPAWIMIKRIGTAENWWLGDNTRNTVNPVINYLSTNTTNLEYSNLSEVFDFTSNGVKIRTTTTAINANGSTYVYLAFAEQPFKFSNAR